MSINNLKALSDSEIANIEGTIGYVFKDKRLLSKAFTHVSYINENKGAVSNERLEFFGDRILNFVAAEKLFFNESGDEGRLTELLKNMVSHIPLSESVKKMGIGQYLKMSKGSPCADGKAVSDLYEAILGAIYADCRDINICREFVSRTMVTVEVVNHKTLLKEWAEKNKVEIEKLFEESGDGAAKVFGIKIIADNKEFCAENKNKDEAEKDASKKACEHFGIK